MTDRSEMATKNQKGQETARRSRSHPKSRKGCGNCKIRKVKCDETQPSCKRCISYATSCNYDSRDEAFQPVARRNGYLHTLCPPPCSENGLILEIINSMPGVHPMSSSSLSHGSGRFSRCDLEILDKFHRRTVLTIGIGTCSHVYQNAYAKLTLSVRQAWLLLLARTHDIQHPFLFHIVLTLTLMHDQHLAPELNSKLTAAIAFHWSQGAYLLNRRLSDGIVPSERDALWACAGLLGALSFASSPAHTPEESWPLKPHSPSDLDWLRMTEGKRAIWKIADPMREDSLFYPMVPNFMQFATPDSCSAELQKLPPELIQLCNIHDSITPDSNPYLAAASFLARMIGIECSAQNFGSFLSLMGCMHRDFRELLEQKDPCALLLFAYWYAMISSLQEWWMLRRTSLECQAICTYLELHHGDDSNVLSTLRRIRTILNDHDA